MQVYRSECQLGEHTLILETGKLAKQAHGAVTVQCGETLTLVASVEGTAREGQDFFPLTVDYREKTYAAGKFPGGFIKREGRPSTKEILTARLIDRPIRPLFPEGYVNEVQVMCTVFSADTENDPDILSMIGASASLHISPIPFVQPTGSIRVGRVKGEFIAMPTYDQMQESDLDLVVSGTADAVTMIEGFAREMPEADMMEAILFAHEHIRNIVQCIHNLRKEMGLEDKEIPQGEENPVLQELRSKHYDELRKRKQTEGKLERAAAVEELFEEIKKEYEPAEGEEPKVEPHVVSNALHELESIVIRDLILEGTRIDGRDSKTIRPIYCEVGVLPRTHGSAIFQRGETQALVLTTLGTSSDEQRVDGLVEEYSKKFMLDYNFPPFSVGECRAIRGPGRREIGHGNLAERSLNAVIPPVGIFPYTIRLVSEILESNGSSSMASVCGGTLALMDAGVPITDPVAGISIGLVKEKDRFTLLTDIVGDEDHFGDMDFKIAGTGRGITGIQLDLKINGIDEEIIRATLEQAREARRDILRQMLSTLRQPRGELSNRAPRLLKVQIPPEKIGMLIGPAGKNIKSIQEGTGAKIDIEEDGTVYIAHSESEGAEAARALVEAVTEEVKVGRVYEGRVTSVKDFGAFVDIAGGREGLVHISELDDKFVNRVDEVVKVGERMKVKVIGIDDQDRIKLSRKALMESSDTDDDSEGDDNGSRSEKQSSSRRRRSKN